MMRVRPNRAMSLASAVIAIGILLAGIAGGVLRQGWFGLLWVGVFIFMLATFLYNAFSKRGISMWTIDRADGDDSDDEAAGSSRR